MALYIQYGAAVQVVGYREQQGRFKLCCRYDTGVCVFASLEELRADDGLVEIEAAFRVVLGYSPWNRIDQLRRV